MTIPSFPDRCQQLALAVAMAVFVHAAPQPAQAFAYVFAGEANGIDVVTHPVGYTGTGGTLNVTVGIDPTSAFVSEMVTSVQNVIRTWNGLAATTGNLVRGSNNNVGASQIDFESALLHELGHAIGLAHVNAGTESELTGSNQNYTKATDGANNTFDIDPGGDGIIGSADDLRGDDVNLNYFKTDSNNPFELASTVDSTTYSRDTENLPEGDSFSANADRAVASALGIADTESVMQQGAFFDEAQRTLAADDVAGIRYAMTGIDEIFGTADDYVLNLIYSGISSTSDIVIDFDNSQTEFAVTDRNGRFIRGDHIQILNPRIFFNTGFDWFFNDRSNEAVPEPSSLLMMGLAACGVWTLRRRRKGRAGSSKTDA